jgi:hypothetical protein
MNEAALYRDNRLPSLIVLPVTHSVCLRGFVTRPNLCRMLCALGLLAPAAPARAQTPALDTVQAGYQTGRA